MTDQQARAYECPCVACTAMRDPRARPLALRFLSEYAKSLMSPETLQRHADADAEQFGQG